jgi:hypothetical protein
VNFYEGSGRRQAKFDLGDAVLLVGSFLILGLASTDQFGLLSLSSLGRFCLTKRYEMLSYLKLYQEGECFIGMVA